MVVWRRKEGTSLGFSPHNWDIGLEFPVMVKGNSALYSVACETAEIALFVKKKQKAKIR